MSADVLPLRPEDAAFIVDDERKRWATIEARLVLTVGRAPRRIGLEDGSAGYVLGLQQFRSLDELEDFVDSQEGAR